jgi:HPt (histidine-containing phosphotransfer) domain-containing protein
MTIKECYDAMGADYEDVLNRLRKEDRVAKFLRKVPEDPSYDLLCRSMESRDLEEAFRAAHTMKGICQNLSLNSLYQPVSHLTELLRGRTEYIPELEDALENVKRVYTFSVECIRSLDA